METIIVVVAAKGCRMFVRLAACSGPRRLVLLGNCQCGVRLRQGRRLRRRYRGTTRLAADCGGLLSFAGLLQCGTSSEDGSSDFFGLLARRRRLCERAEQHSKVNL